MDTYNIQRLLIELENQRNIIEKENFKLQYIKTEKDAFNLNLNIQIVSPGGSKYIEEGFYFSCCDIEERKALENIRLNIKDIYEHRIKEAKDKFDKIMDNIKELRKDEV
jgi:hypothetical protein